MVQSEAEPTALPLRNKVNALSTVMMMLAADGTLPCGGHQSLRKAREAAAAPFLASFVQIQEELEKFRARAGAK